MCLGIPGRVVGLDGAHDDLASVDVQGVARPINVALLEQRPAIGDWVLVHMGFAMEPMTPRAAADALGFMTADQAHIDGVLDELRPDGSTGGAPSRPDLPPWAVDG